MVLCDGFWGWILVFDIHRAYNSTKNWFDLATRQSGDVDFDGINHQFEEMANMRYDTRR